MLLFILDNMLKETAYFKKIYQKHFHQNFIHLEVNHGEKIILYYTIVQRFKKKVREFCYNYMESPNFTKLQIQLLYSTKTHSFLKLESM